MSNLTYTRGRPAGNISPGAQRSSMTINNDSNEDIWDEDHYGFNDNNGGTHQFNRYPLNVPLPSMTGLESGTNTAPGTADNTKSQFFYKNAWGIMPLSLIKAYGYFDVNGVLQNGFNLNTPVGGVGSAYTLSFMTPLPTNAYGVFAFSVFQTGTGTASFMNYSAITVNGFTLNNTSNTRNPFAVVVLQA